MKVIFMGTPDFAVPFLEDLILSKHSVVAAFTQAPKMQGRGMQLKITPIAEVAQKHNIPVFTPKTLKAQEIYDLINQIDADVIVVVAYGFILPKNILVNKKYGCINVHPSLLPKYRGPAPMQHTIINGDKETGVCIIQMDEGMDTGDIILQEKFTIDDNITLLELSLQCQNVGSKLLLKVLNDIDILPRIKQAENGASIAGKILKEHSKIDWSETSFQIHCKVRSMNPNPGIFFNYKGDKIKILKTEYIDQEHNFNIGEVVDNKLSIACGYGILKILELQKSGKRIMNASEFLHGNKIPVGTILN